MTKESKHKDVDLEHSEELSDLEKLVENIKENPLLYIAGAAIVFIAAIAGWATNAHRESVSKEVMTSYTKALATVEAGTRAAELEGMAKAKTFQTSKTLYMAGESAYQAKEYDKAKSLFEQVRKDYPTSEDVPGAIEALGNIAENKDDYTGALALYNEIIANWKDTFTGRHQKLNIGRCQEKLGELAEAKKAYEEQIEDFADSGFAAMAQGALAKLKIINPALFPVEEVKEEAAALSSTVEVVEDAASETTAEEAVSDEKVDAGSETKEEPATEEAPE